MGPAIMLIPAPTEQQQTIAFDSQMSGYCNPLGSATIGGRSHQPVSHIPRLARYAVRCLGRPKLISILLLFQYSPTCRCLPRLVR
jgi:hypothetical protein